MAKKQQPSIVSWLGAILLSLLISGLVFVLVLELLPKVGSKPPVAQPTSPMDLVRSQQPGLRVLFVGNSLTYFNDLPNLVRQLAEAAKASPPLMPIQQVHGGYTLKRHWAEGAVPKLLDEARWNYVVLQEHSREPSFPREQLDEEMYPYVRKFHDLIKFADAKTLLFMTWGHKEGDLVNLSSDTYWAMQARISKGYGDIAKELAVPIVPVGTAWATALQAQPDINLWDTDGLHPSLKGSYLAACVFYGVFYHKASTGNSFLAGLEPKVALFLQTVATKVLGYP